MLKRPWRKPTFESVEERVVLSATSSFLSGLSFATSSLVSRQTVTARDNTTATATDLGEIDGGRIVRGYVGRADVRDVYRFTLEHEADIDFQLNGLAADADLYLLDQHRSLLATSKNANANTESISGDLPAGDYFVYVERYRPWQSTHYNLSLEATAKSVPDGAGNTFDTAADIGTLNDDRSFSGSVGVGRDAADLIRFSVDTVSQVTFGLNGLSQDIDLYLFSESQAQLGASRGSGTNNEQLSAWMAPGTYYLGVLPYREAESDYHLQIGVSGSQPTPSPDPATPTEPPATPPPTPIPPETGNPLPATPTPNVPANQPLEDVAYFGGSREWGINDVGAPEAWSNGFTGQGITVAVVDSGVQLNHPDLVDSIWENADEILGDGIDNDRNGYVDDRYGWDFISNDNSPNDGNSHGTHVAGIVAASNDGSGATGVAHDARIMPIRVLDNNGSGSSAGVARGIRYAVDNGADIINLSLGGSYSSQIDSALQYAQQNDVFVVAASGNEDAGVPGYPAALSRNLTNMLSVGAYNSSRNSADFSNAVGNSGAVQVDAPGVSIYNTLPTNRYGNLSGTSMASPYVAGVAALTLSANPQLTSRELREVLTQGATQQVNGSDAIGSVSAQRSIPVAITVG